MKNAFLLASVLSCIAALQLHAQDTTYNWSGSGGFTGSITLDSPSSTSGGLGDIVSIYMEDPASDGGPYGPFANFPTDISIPGFGIFTLPALEFDATDATVSGLFQWNASQITSMDLTWTIGDSVLTFDADPVAGNSIGYVNYDAPTSASDDTGLWLEGPLVSNTPDGGDAALLLSGALAGMGFLFRKPAA